MTEPLTPVNYDPDHCRIESRDLGERRVYDLIHDDERGPLILFGLDERPDAVDLLWALLRARNDGYAAGYRHALER